MRDAVKKKNKTHLCNAEEVTIKRNSNYMNIIIGKTLKYEVEKNLNYYFDLIIKECTKTDSRLSLRCQVAVLGF